MNAIECTRCDTAIPMQPFGRPDASGQLWLYCSVCSNTVLVSAEGLIVRHGSEVVQKAG